MAFNSSSVPKRAHNKTWKIPYIKIFEKSIVMGMHKKPLPMAYQKKINKKHWPKEK